MKLVLGSSLQPSKLPALHGAAKLVEVCDDAMTACHTLCFSIRQTKHSLDKVPCALGAGA